MNERIKSLVEQSGFAQHGFVWVANDIDIERFTELLVDKCIHYCGDNLSKTVGGALKIHLGIEPTIDDQLRNSSTYFGNNP